MTRSATLTALTAAVVTYNKDKRPCVGARVQELTQALGWTFQEGIEWGTKRADARAKLQGFVIAQTGVRLPLPRCSVSDLYLEMCNEPCCEEPSMPLF